MSFRNTDHRESSHHARSFTGENLREISNEPDARDRGLPMRSYRTILKQQIVTGLVEHRRPTLGLALSSFSAGLDLGFSVLLMAALVTLLRGSVPPAVEHLLVANMYSIGFLMVIMGRSELFTEHTALAVLPVLDRLSSLAELARVWTIVYVGNLLGAAFCACAVVWIGTSLGAAENWAFTEIASSLVDHRWWVVLASSIVAGWLMGELAWMVGACRDTISQLVFVWFITTAIGFLGLHHIVAGTAEVVAGLFAGTDVTFGAAITCLFWSTVGNAVGGVIFVAVIKYGHAVHSSDKTEQEIESEANQLALGESQHDESDEAPQRRSTDGV